jgi:iron(II)-dependent oxidoreductase
MQTTGLAGDVIRGLYEGDRLAPALRDARERTLSIYAHLDLEWLEVPCIPIVNPPLWELAHIAWFQEYWCLRHARGAGGAPGPSLLDGADALFDSSAVPHDARWTLVYPPAERLRRYMDETLEATLAALQRTPEEERYFFRLALLHEDMHGEALLMTLQTLGLPPPPLDLREPPWSRATKRGDVAFPGGEFMQGSHREARAFVFDNEKWAHRVTVDPFAISIDPVTQGEYAEFLDDTQAAPPRHWRREGAAWSARRFDRWSAIDAAATMIHVSLPEAQEFCRWAGRRLPTEAEWEFAARNGGAEDRFPWGDAPIATGPSLDLRYLGPSSSLAEPAPARSGLRHMLGGVWEWTSTPFAPYPGFRPDPYEDYSQPWFHSHYVLRGGSFATRSRLVHNRFRNFYLADRSDVFAGFRTCVIG